MNKKVWVIGHRGAAGLAPENSLAGFAKALEIGVDAFEMDVQPSADGHIVVHHDPRLNPDIARTADGKWLEGHSNPLIKGLTLSQLKTYDMGRLRPGSTYARQYPEQQPADGERIPTLQEVIALLRERDDRTTQLWIEIKTFPKEPDLKNPPEAIVDAVTALLEKEDMGCRTKILSFDWRARGHLQKMAPHIPAVFLSSPYQRFYTIEDGKPGPFPPMEGLDSNGFNTSILHALETLDGRFWGPRFDALSPGHIQQAHRLGIQVSVWTPNSWFDMARLIEMGVDGIITNRPDILKDLVGKV